MLAQLVQSQRHVQLCRLIRPERLLILAAHPDDETLGAAALMARARSVLVVHLTDGAPKAARFRPPQLSCQEYARLRQREAANAMRLLAKRLEDIVPLNLPDQDAVRYLRHAVTALKGIIEEWQPQAVITHSYEGGHPDHDAAAFVAASATRRAQLDGERPLLAEMALYHGFQGRLSVGSFVPGPKPDGEVTEHLTPRQRARKQAMLRSYASQARVLESLCPRDWERYRSAPCYDFSRAPHPGRLLYERWGFPLTGSEWRRYARRACAEAGP